MILAAGFGTRLRPFTHDTPKPLLELLGEPLIENALRHVLRAGCNHVVINTHHLGEQIEERFGATYGGMNLSYSHETEILGTGGGIQKMATQLDLSQGPILILNSDALCDFDVTALIEDHNRNTGVATMLLKQTEDQENFGTLSVTETGRVMRIVDWPSLDLVEAKKGMFLGAHILEPSLLDYLPPQGMSCIVRNGYVPAMADGRVISSFFSTGSFSDVGTPDRLLLANRQILDGSFSQDFLELHRSSQRSSVVIDPSATVHRTARLEGPAKICRGARIGENAYIGPYSTVGENAVVGTSSRVESAIMFSDSVLEPGDSLCGEILSTRQRWSESGQKSD